MNKFAEKILNARGLSSAKMAIRFAWLLLLLATSSALAQTPPAKDKDAPKVSVKSEKSPKDSTKNHQGSVKNNQTQQTNAQQDNITNSKNADIDWGDWNLKPTSQFGVGVQGNIEAEINLLDKSSLIENATGVATKNTPANLANKTKSKDLKKMMAELEAMEAKVKKEIEDDTEF